MCGRYLITSSPEAVRRLFGYREQPNFPPRYNVAPTQAIPIVRLAGGERQFALVRWGLIPAWVKDPKAFSLVINARSDAVLDKPSFRNAMKRRRCLIPADGFYEWKADGPRKRPHAVVPRDGKPVAFAGLWEAWMGPNGEEMETAAIVTADATRSLAHIHHRMPVVIAPEAFDLWLDCRNVDAHTAAALLVPPPEGLFEAYEISTMVNRVANDTAEVLAPAGAAPEPAGDRDPATQAQPDVAQTRAAGGPRRPRKPRKDDRQSSLF
jgi:putative SOS response-associated peptidase YedK